MPNVCTIYLDIDGVLAPYAYFAQLKILAKKCVENFNLLLSSIPDLDYDVCIISSWCSLFEPTELQNIFYHYGINTDRIMTFRSKDVGITREKFVQKDVAEKNITNYIVLDDEFLKLNDEDAKWHDSKVITPKSRIGLSNEDVLKFLRIQRTL